MANERVQGTDHGYGVIVVDLIGNCRVWPLGCSHSWLSDLDDRCFFSRYCGADQPLRCRARSQSGRDIL